MGCYNKYSGWRLHYVSSLFDTVIIVFAYVQPDKPTWNLMGMLNNPWFRVKVRRIASADGGARVRFEHPTLAGNQPGGWMAELKEHPSLTAPGVYLDPKSDG